MTTDKIISIPLAPSHLLDSPSNPRRTYNDASLAELAESIKSQGLLQPIVVRLLAMGRPHQYELVFGHRRTRAARLAGLEFIPAIVRDMTDDQVAVAQIHENLEREDVSPIEEAEGFQRLMREHGYTAHQLMGDTGKSRSFIYGRLKLLNAREAVREAMANGLPADVALKISRLPTAAIQAKALDEVRHTEWVDGKHVPAGWMSVRDGLETLDDREFFIAIAEARFNPEDASLHPEGRICSTCPHNSVNDPEASAAFSADTCTDVPCFELRTEAARQQLIERHRAAGTLIEGEAAKQAGGSMYRPYWLQGPGVMRLSDPIADDRSQTVRTVMDRIAAEGGTLPPLHLLARSEAQTELVLDREHLPALWAAAGLHNPWEERATQNEAKASADDEDDEGDDDDSPQHPLPLPPTPEERAARDNWDDIKAAIMLAAAKRSRTMDELRLIAEASLEISDGVSRHLVDAMGWAPELNPEPEPYVPADVICAKLPELSADQLGLLIVLLAIDYGPRGYGSQLCMARINLARSYGVNPLEPAATPNEATPTPSKAARAPERVARDVRYRNAATGETWSGRGQMPRWLKVATAGGAKLTDFAVQADLVAGAAGESSSTTPAHAGGVDATAGAEA